MEGLTSVRKSGLSNISGRGNEKGAHKGWEEKTEKITNDKKKVVHSLSWPPTCLGQSYHPNLKWSPRNPGGAPQRATIDWKFGIIQKCTSFTKIFPSTNKNVSNLWQLDKQDSWFIVEEHVEHQPSWVLLSRLSCPSQGWGVKDGTLEVVDMSNKPSMVFNGSINGTP